MLWDSMSRNITFAWRIMEDFKEDTSLDMYIEGWDELLKGPEF